MGYQSFLILFLAIIAVSFIGSQVLNYLNRRSNAQALPEDLNDIYDPEQYKQAMAYQAATGKFELVSSTFSFLVLFTVIATGFLGQIDAWARYHFLWELPQALAFFGVLFLGSDLLALPFSLYGTFVIEKRFGFNKTTLKTFVLDKLKGYVITAIIGGLLLSVFIFFVFWRGTEFWLWFWAVAILFMLLANTFFTSLILPLFNKLTPLPDGELKTAIEAYAAKVKFPLNNILVIDGSKRSAKSNAFFTGWGRRKKVVLYDTLLQQHTTDELVAILAHEVGHYKKKHIITGLVIGIAQIGLTLFVLSLMIYNTDISLAMGGNKTSYHLNLLAFGILYSPITQLLGLAQNAHSRKNEFEADAFAASTADPMAMISALKKLTSHNLSELLPHSWYVFFNYSHPPVRQRLNALKSVSDR